MEAQWQYHNIFITAAPNWLSYIHGSGLHISKERKTVTFRSSFDRTCLVISGDFCFYYYWIFNLIMHVLLTAFKLRMTQNDSLFFQVSSMELVQEIHQLLMDREDSCFRTCFSLQLDNVTLDNFAELKSIEGLKEGSVIKVMEG